MPENKFQENKRGDTMQKTAAFQIDESGWIHCPVCGCRTRTKIRSETIVMNFPIFCPKCRHECLIDAKQLKIRLSVEPVARQ